MRGSSRKIEDGKCRSNLAVTDDALNQQLRVSFLDVVEINGVISISNDLNTLDLVTIGAGVYGNPSIPSVEIVNAYRMRRFSSQNSKVEPGLRPSSW
jgi:hypothetical protein